jgi:hypothetical protein
VTDTLAPAALRTAAETTLKDLLLVERPLDEPRAEA